MGPKPYNSINNRTAKIIITKAVNRQNIITISCVILNVLVTYLLNHYTENYVISTIVGVALLLIPITYAFSIKKALKIKPEMDYEGYWKYELDFEVIVDNNDAYFEEPIKYLKQRFHNNVERGVTHLKRNGIDLRVVFAKGKVKDGAKIKWSSDPAIYDSNSIRWFFIGEIVWDKGFRQRVKNLSCEFNGFEYYTVDARDENKRPTHMTGKLLGCNQQMGHFSIKANIKYLRISESEYNSYLDELMEIESTPENHT